MADEHILVVEDDEDILELVRYNLWKEGFRVTTAGTGEDALRLAWSELPDLMVLDLMLPGLNGLEVCRSLKRDEKTAGISVLMLTARGEEADIVRGLEVGADDYMPKPFSPRVLVARIRAILRRAAGAEEPEPDVIEIGDLSIHPGRHEVIACGEPVDLTHTEFRLLHTLARRPGWVFTRNRIIDSLHGSEYIVTDRSVDVQVSGLRKKLGECCDYIETIRGVGYRFRDFS